jgi:hypothetical protein
MYSPGTLFLLLIFDDLRHIPIAEIYSAQVACKRYNLNMRFLRKKASDGQAIA